MTPTPTSFAKKVTAANRRKINDLLLKANEERSRRITKGFKPMGSVITQFKKQLKTLMTQLEKKKAIALLKEREITVVNALLKKKDTYADDSEVLSSVKNKFRTAFRRYFTQFAAISKLKSKGRNDLVNILEEYNNSLHPIDDLLVHLGDLELLPVGVTKFTPPFEFTEASANFDMDEDEYLIADIQSGLVATGFKAGIDSMDIAIVFDLDPWVIFDTYAGMGVSYTLPSTGILKITVVAQNTQSHLYGSLSDDFGFSDGDVQITAGIYLNVLHPNNVNLNEEVLTTLKFSSGGDDISKSQSNLQTAIPYIVTLHSTGAFAVGETVQIIVGSKVTILNRVDDMHTYNQVDVSWQIKEINVETV
ncbi:MAG TPA: hypothetical protein VMZ69_09330 [Saprospiraceae bacterium]|nr:hypothetical protein [Saprospiraceae bacterium]